MNEPEFDTIEKALDYVLKNCTAEIEAKVDELLAKGKCPKIRLFSECEHGVLEWWDNCPHCYER